jgi:long-subunit acyl-CoA synthetase (AMP-forming)
MQQVCLPLQEAVEIGSKLFCLQDKDLRTFLHDAAAAVPVSAVVPPSVWDQLEARMQTDSFGSASDRTRFKVCTCAL